MLTVIRHFYAILKQFVPWFCNHKSMGLVGVECFMYITYILLNLWWWENVNLFFAFWKKHFICKILFLIFLRQNYLLQNWHHICLCTSRVWNNLLHFWGKRVERNKKQNHELFCYLMLFINNKLLKNMIIVLILYLNLIQ